MKVREFEIARADVANKVKPMLSHWKSYASHLTDHKQRLEAECLTLEMELVSARKDILVMEAMLELTQRKKFEDIAESEHNISFIRKPPLD